MLNVKIIVGSTREGRFSEKLLPWLTTELAKRDNFTTEVLDLRDQNLPFLDSPISPSAIKDRAYNHDSIKAWSAKIEEADAFIMITPEYNHSTSAVLKNAIDVLYPEWRKKAVGFIGYGTVGGADAVTQLRTVTAETEMVSARKAVRIALPWTLLDEEKALKEGVLDHHINDLNLMLDQLTWWGEVLKEARNKA